MAAFCISRNAFSKTDIQLVYQLVMKYVMLFLIVTPFFSSTNSISDFNNCWFMDMYDWHTFRADQDLCVDLTRQWVLLEIKFALAITKKYVQSGKVPF